MTDNLIDSIRAALAPDATADARAAGVAACRTILAALDATPGVPLGAPTASVQPGPVASAVAELIRKTPPDQLFDMLIARLRPLVPADQQAPTHKLSIPHVPVPKP